MPPSQHWARVRWNFSPRQRRASHSFLRSSPSVPYSSPAILARWYALTFG